MFSKLKVGTLFLLTFLTSIASAHAQDTGHIQVRGASDVQVFLDGIFRGITAVDVGGLVLQNVSSGAHTLRATKAGYQPQERRIVVKRGEVFVYTLQPFAPQIVIQQEGEEAKVQAQRKVGTLVVQTLPVEALISIPSLGISNSQKVKDRWSANALPEGRHYATFASSGKSLNYTVSVIEGETTSLFVNFLEGRVIDRSAQARESLERQRQVAALDEKGRSDLVNSIAGTWRVDRSHGSLPDLEISTHVGQFSGPGILIAGDPEESRIGFFSSTGEISASLRCGSVVAGTQCSNQPVFEYFIVVDRRTLRRELHFQDNYGKKRTEVQLLYRKTSQ